jgi:hypothetical protein
MRIILVSLFMISISVLSGCSSMTGNVIPSIGPTMEKIYDNVETRPTPEVTHVSRLTVNNTKFNKLRNPELKMYVYPHFAGKDGVPIPGYFTVFNCYTQEYYELKKGC